MSELAEKRPGRRMPGGTLRVLVVGAAIVAVLAAGAIGLKKAFFTESDTKQLGFRDIGELATQVAYCTEVNVTEASRELFGVSIPFTQSKYIYSYDVVVRAGMNFDEIDYTVDDAAGTIWVSLPETRVLSCEIDTDSFRLYHEEESIFRQISMEENNEALSAMRGSAEKNAIANGLLENARKNAEAILTGFFAQNYDLTSYTINYTDKGAL